MEKIEITWIDSHSVYGWMSIDNAKEHIKTIDMICTSVGYKFAEDEENLHITISQASSDLIQTIMTIPKLAIKKVKKLR
jgi:hypothetical protein